MIQFPYDKTIAKAIAKGVKPTKAAIAR